MVAWVMAGVFVVQAAHGQQEEAIRQQVQRLFDSMRAADSQGIADVFSDSAILQTVSFSPTGETFVRTSPVQQFARSVGKAPQGALDEKISFGSVQWDGALASVWTPYRFYYIGTFSHCGVNSFQLILVNGRWKIHYLIDTRRKEGCD